MENNFNNYNNSDNDLENNMDSTESTTTDTAATSSTGASGSIYSYSYINQENQERNPNYYEKKEEDSSNVQSVYTADSQRTYTTGNYGNTEGSGHIGSQGTQGTYNAGGYNTQGAYNAGSNSAWNGSQGNFAGTTGQGTFQNQGASYQKAKKEPRIKKQHGFGVTVAKCAALALIFGLVSSTVFYGTGLAFKHTTGLNNTQQETVTESTKPAEVTTKPDSGSLPATSVSTATTVNDVSDIAENVMPSIVSITNMSLAVEQDFFGRLYQEEVPGAGSGIIVGQNDEEIYIATNNHVVANSTQLTVNFVDDQQVAAEIKGTDASTDLAVVSVKTKDIPSDTLSKIKVATLGSSDDVKVGQSVVAIGNALGYGQSVTTGVISALEREVTIQDETTGTSVTNDLLQTDAAINPGNSGGALLNMNGELIGINSAKYSDTQVEGMGYAIPISAAEPIINNMITREIVDESNSAYLGVTGQDVTSDVAKSFGMPEGLYITMVVENSAAEQAGIRKGDVLTKFDGRKITSMDGLSDTIQYYAAGSQVEVTLQTNENGEWREKTLTVTLGKKND